MNGTLLLTFVSVGWNLLGTWSTSEQFYWIRILIIWDIASICGNVLQSISWPRSSTSQTFFPFVFLLSSLINEYTHTHLINRRLQEKVWCLFCIVYYHLTMVNKESSPLKPYLMPMNLNIYVLFYFIVKSFLNNRMSIRKVDVKFRDNYFTKSYLTQTLVFYLMIKKSRS